MAFILSGLVLSGCPYTEVMRAPEDRSGEATAAADVDAGRYDLARAPTALRTSSGGGLANSREHRLFVTSGSSQPLGMTASAHYRIGLALRTEPTRQQDR
jgi:hypothetical protein